MNDLTTLDPNQLPAYLQNAFADSAVNNLAGAPSIDRISIRGRVWRLIHGGTEVGVNASQSLDVVIIAAAPHISRQYYKDAFKDDVKVAPTCWSTDGNVPDIGVQIKQSAACATCPNNQAGSGQNDSKACRHQQRIAVALPDNLEHVYAMTIPATSLWGDKVNPGSPAPLTQYAKFLASKRLPIEAVKTRMSFDINQTATTIRFQAAGFLSQDDFYTAKELAQTEEAKEAIANNVIVREVTAEGPAMTGVPDTAPGMQLTGQPAGAPQGQATIAPQANQTPVSGGGFAPVVQPQQGGFAPTQTATGGFVATQTTQPQQPSPSLFDAAAIQPAAGFQPTGAEPTKRGRRAAKPVTVEAQAIPEPTVIPANAAQPNVPANQEIADLIQSWSLDG